MHKALNFHIHMVADLCDLLDHDCAVEILTFEDEQGQRAFNHTASHILAQAVQHLFPGAKLAIGPAIEDGFYYDFDVPTPFTPEDLEKLEAEMAAIAKQDLPIERFSLPVEEAKKLMADQPYKLELIEEHAGKGEAIAFRRQGDFTDLCAGPHLMSTGPVKAVKLTSCTGAYWRGSEKNKMLSRVYGCALPWKNTWPGWRKPAAATTISWAVSWNTSPPLMSSARACRSCCPRAPGWSS